MNRERFEAITSRYARLRVAIVGDFCLDRYLEIDPAKNETSIETSLTVYNVVNVRGQPGGAGTILNNLCALGIGEIYPVGFFGEDGEGYELDRAMRARPRVHLDHFLSTSLRRTFTYTKPLLISEGKGPVELNRLDLKNWTTTPRSLQEEIAQRIRKLSTQIDAIILLDQVDLPDTGVVTPAVLGVIRELVQANPNLLVLADSRRSLRGYPPVCLKMNRSEFHALTETRGLLNLKELQERAADLARQNGQPLFVTLAEEGIIAAAANGTATHHPALPVRGEIDIVGAGDAVTANLVSALAGGATLAESIELACYAASIVIHQLGSTGSASVQQMAALLGNEPSPT